MNVTRRSRRRQALEPARHPGAGQRGSGGRQRLGKIIGDASRSVGVEHYGASADYQTLYRQFGITAAAVAAAARDSIYDAQNGTRPGGARHLCPSRRRRHRRLPCLIRKVRP